MSQPPPNTPAPRLPDYELLRLIGRGSYGEVWLARGVTGIYRAIKIVRRASFNEAAPFEREFKGLKEFAAVSLGESIQLALLHVGRDDRAGFFYYVMELADDVERGRDILPASYVPLTLTELRERRGRVPAADCLRIGVELSRVLAGLHAQGLVHRDIKPSNVILVSGVPKLADIGLVAPTSTVLTFVGTEGFVPPEGPGRPGADVYALGKVLYELSTGLDRQEFPQLPKDLARLPDQKLVLEVNEIILKSCDTNPAHRYVDGAAIHADLRALQDGSLARSRRRRGLGRRVGAVLLAAAVIGAGVWWWKRPAPTATPAAASATATPAVISARSIAVLPFANYSDDKANGFFADGVYDDILTNLANLGALRVISRTTMLQYRETKKSTREIAAELGVAYVLEGSVRRAGNKVRVTGQLIRAATDEQVWAETYDRDLTDVFAIQSELSHAIAAALNGALTPADESRLARRPTTSLAAYDLYQRARALEGSYDPQAGAEQLALYEQAVRLDPNYAEAWARLSGARYSVTGDAFESVTAAQQKLARAALTRAEELDPDNYAVLMAGANFGAVTGDRDLVNRRRQRIIELFPHRAEARFVAGLTAGHEDRWEDALVEFRAARALDPHNPELLGNLESLLGDLRRYDELIEVLQAHRALQPEKQELAFQLALARLFRSGSTAELSSYLANLPPNPGFTDINLTSYRAQALFMLGDAEKFVQLWREAGPRWKFDDGGIFDNLAPAMALLSLNQRAAARPLLEKTRDYCRSVVARNPSVIPRWNLLGLSLALLGETAEARSTLAHVRELLRTEAGGALIDPGVMFYNSLWRAWTGEKAEAVAEIDRRLGGPVSTTHAHVNELRTSLFSWPLHGDPAFEAMLNDPANNAPVFGNKPAPAAAPAAAENDHTIAVLAFETFSDSKDTAYLVDGLQDDVVTNLAGVPALRVISRESLKRYRGTTKTMKEVGAELKATYILGGSLRREGNMIRLNAHLVDVRTDTEIWARQFNREATEILKLQGDLASEIVPALQVVLTPGEKAALTKAPTASAAAYDLYLQGVQFWNTPHPELTTTEWDSHVVDLLQRATAADPGFVRAWVMLAAVHRVAYFQGNDRSEARILRAEQAIAEARRLAPEEPEVLVGLGQVEHYLHKDYPKAIAFYRQALATHPNFPNAHHNLAFLYRRLGRWAEALAEFREAWKGEPDDRQLAREVYRLLIDGQRFPEAFDVKRQIQSYWPADNRDIAFDLAWGSLIANGDTTEIQQLLAAMPAEERETEDVIDLRIGFAGDTGDEKTLINLIRRHGLTFEQIDYAGVLLFRGEHELLRQQLDKMKPGMEKMLKERPLNAPTWTRMARYQALRGNRAEALAAIDRARQLVPEAGDAANGVRYNLDNTKALLWLGEKDAAIAEITRLIRHPRGVHTWELERTVWWQPIRDDPRIQALIADPKNREPLF